MAQSQPEFGLTLPILLLCCSEFLKRVLEIWRPWSRNGLGGDQRRSPRSRFHSTNPASFLDLRSQPNATFAFSSKLASQRGMPLAQTKVVFAPELHRTLSSFTCVLRSFPVGSTAIDERPQMAAHWPIPRRPSGCCLGHVGRLDDLLFRRGQRRHLENS